MRGGEWGQIELIPMAIFFISSVEMIQSDGSSVKLDLFLLKFAKIGGESIKMAANLKGFRRNGTEMAAYGAASDEFNRSGLKLNRLFSRNRFETEANGAKFEELRWE